MLQIRNEDRKIMLACSTDNCRPNINHVCIKNGVSYATDGHILAAAKNFNTELTEDVLVKLDPKIGRNDKPSEVEIKPGKTLDSEGRVVEFDEYKCGYPDVNRVATPIKNKPVTIGIDVKLLVKLSKIMDSNYLFLEFDAENIADRIYVAADGRNTTPDIACLMMPLRNDNNINPAEIFAEINQPK